MAKFKVEWSIEARLDLIDILDFYVKRNGNNQYSRKLYFQINKNINLISKNPNIGAKTEIETVRALIMGHYQIIYEIIESIILVVMIWDCRRDPEDKIVSTRLKK
jgi:plasmid stabilization system protein ParE